MSDGADSLLQGGQLDQAIEALVAQVRGKPTDVKARVMLAELYCFRSDFERADRQLDVVTSQDPSITVGLGLFRQLIRGADLRRKIYAEGAAPKLVGPLPDHAALRLRALVELRGGGDAAALIAEAEQKRPAHRIAVNGGAADDFRDLDDILASVIELITAGGDCYWVPVEAVESIELHKPAMLREMLWRRASVVVKDGPNGDVYLPTVYPAYPDLPSPSQEALLGRATDWIEHPRGVVRGVGLKSFLAGDESLTLLELSALSNAA
ncbi:MAG: type VI secretion system accessory protein TagJ [Rhodospirillales bacterium]